MCSEEENRTEQQVLSADSHTPSGTEPPRGAGTASRLQKSPSSARTSPAEK